MEIKFKVVHCYCETKCEYRTALDGDMFSTTCHVGSAFCQMCEYYDKTNEVIHSGVGILKCNQPEKEEEK